MSISADELAHLARLANLRLDEHDQDKLRSQIDQILAFVEKLQSCDLEWVEPMAHPLEEVTLQPREGVESWGAWEDLLANVAHPLEWGAISIRSMIDTDS